MKVRNAIIVSILTLAVSLQAAEEADVVVRASRGGHVVLRTAGNPTVMTSTEISRLGYDNIVDVVKHAEGTLFRSTSGNAAQSEVSMRGFGENSHGRVLIVLNGRRINRPDQAGINWLQIPIDSVERIEIERGGNSALYGDHAVAGVISIVTRKTAKEPTASVSASVGSFSTDTEHVGVAGSLGNRAYSVDAGHQETDGYRDRSAYSAWNVGGNVACDFGDALSLSLALSYNTIDFELPGDLSKAEVEANREQSSSPDDSAENEYMNADAGLTFDLEDRGAASFNVTFGRKDMASDLSSWFLFADTVIDTLGVLPSYSLNHEIAGRANAITAGIDYYADDMSVKRYMSAARSTKTLDADIRKTTTGLYARDEFSVQENLVLGIGGRVERADVEGKVSASGATLFDESKSHDSSVFDVSAVYVFLEDSKVFARYSTVYRYPFVDEQISYYGYGTDQFYQDIDAEKGSDLELGTSIGLCDVARVSLTAFLLDMEDEIAWNNATFRNENLAETRHTGLEASASWQIAERVSLHGSYTYTEATFAAGENDGNDIPAAPRHIASGRMDVSLPMDLQLGVGLKYVGDSYLGQDFGNVGDKLPEYTVVDLSVRCTPSAVEGLDLFAAVDNLFDEEYSSTGFHGGSWGVDTYYPAPTRSFRAGASYSF